VQLSFGPIGWLMISEVFPLKLRGRGLSVAVLVNFASNALVTFALSIGGTSLSCCYCRAIGVLYFYLQDVNDMKLVVNNCTVCTLL
jgi:hypothetical protein